MNRIIQIENLIFIQFNFEQDNQTEVELRDAFKLMDTDNNGYITEAEMRLGFIQLGYVHSMRLRKF